MSGFGDSEWQRKGATLSDKTARKEFGLTQAEIVSLARGFGRSLCLLRTRSFCFFTLRALRVGTCPQLCDGAAFARACTSHLRAERSQVLATKGKTWVLYGGAQPGVLVPG
jgi:hypothetical protein